MKESWHWNYDNLKRLIGQSESFNLEFKGSGLFQQSRNKIAEVLSKEVSAFANTEGGTIVIGITEKRDGKMPIASSIDDGVEIQKWPPEVVQQLIEANVRPYLTGMRVNPIFLDPEKTRCAYVIHVPQGRTAYQARDLRYYGRSEYQCKSLPDDEIRLRMFRGQLPHATVQVVQNFRAVSKITRKDLTEILKDDGYRKRFDVDRFLKETQFWEHLKNVNSDQAIPLHIYHFVIAIKNLGELDITEFKLKVDFPPNNPFYQKSYTRVVKDGWLPRSGKTIGLTAAIAGRMQVNIYPQDTFDIQAHEFFCLPDYTLSQEPLSFRWTLYLSNTLPIQGSHEIPDFEVFPQLT